MSIKAMTECDYEAKWEEINCLAVTNFHEPERVGGEALRAFVEAQLAEVQTEALPGERDRLIDRIAERDATIARLEEEKAALVEALAPFADCCDQISDAEDDEEWAKFRLLIKDYRRARAFLAKIGVHLPQKGE